MAARPGGALLSAHAGLQSRAAMRLNRGSGGATLVRNT